MTKDLLTNQPPHNGDPDCKLCYGKGYSSELTGISWGRGDFGGGEPGRQDVLNMKPCKCTLPKTDDTECPQSWDGAPCSCVKTEPTQEPAKPWWWDELDVLLENEAGFGTLSKLVEKVEDQAYERGKKETRSDALREAVEKLEGMKFKPTKDMLGDNADYYERGFVKSLHYAIETLESLLTNPKDK